MSPTKRPATSEIDDSRIQKATRVANESRTTKEDTSPNRLQFIHVSQDFRLHTLNESCKKYNRFLPFAKFKRHGIYEQGAEVLEAVNNAKAEIERTKKKLAQMSADLEDLVDDFAVEITCHSDAYKRGDLLCMYRAIILRHLKCELTLLL